MLPSLYVDYMSNENYNAIVKQHKGYLKDGSYQHVEIKNPSCITLEVPFKDESVIVTGKSFQTTITPSTDEMKTLLSDIKGYVKLQMDAFQADDQNFNQDKMNEELKVKVSEWKDSLMSQAGLLNDLPFDIKTQTDTSYLQNYWDESTKLHYYSEDTLFIEAGVEDGTNHYTNYIGFTFDSDRIILSYLPTMTPQINEITPIVVRSLPMLIAVIVLFALVVSYLYSKGIVNPIIALVKHTEMVKGSGMIANASLPVKGNDEIAMLVRTLNELYEELDKNYKTLEHINDELNEKNKRQQVFLRSSSHQLKTPIAAALLLVEGMINQVGKYQDMKVYLPEVKLQLLSMRKIVEDILYLSRCEENVTFERIDLNVLVNSQLLQHQFALAEGRFTLVTDYQDGSFVTSDSNLLPKIVDNLISNAIVHSKEGATITIMTKSNQLEIHNSDAHIDEALMPNIFEPFVQGSHHGKGHGLGLYIVTYYANILGATVKIMNSKDGVLTKVVFNPHF
jgi:signal transduction histidine kinase